jgi:hypothetical protein
MHCAQHASNKLVDTIALLHKRYQRGDSALIVSTRLEMREDQLLETINLILQSHKVGNSLVSIPSSVVNQPRNQNPRIPLIRIIDRLQADVFLVLEQACTSQSTYAPLSTSNRPVPAYH